MISKSANISFSLNGIDDLAKELAKPFVRVSLVYPNKSFLIEKDRWISSLTLWDENHAGLRITSKIFDVAERVEVGSLAFQRVGEAGERDEFFELSENFSQDTFFEKIILNASGKRVETGIIITAANDAQIIIVPNAMPCKLAIRCKEIGLQHFEPEYGLEEYMIETWQVEKGSESL